MKIALVHDDFVQSGGAESLFATIASIWKDAPIFTSVVNWDKFPSSIDRERVTTSWMQNIPFSQKIYKVLLPLYPFAFESFNFDDFDLVISSTTRFAKSIVTKPTTVHVCYINSIPRFLWDSQIQKEYMPSFLQFLISLFLKWLQRWDKVVSTRVDYYIANSQNVAQNLKKIYQRDCKIIYPFADIDFFKPAKIHHWQLKSQNYYLVVSRLAKWKRIDLAIESCASLNKKLIIVGEGPDKKRLKSLAQILEAKVDFVGKVTRNQLRTFYQNCQALIVTQQEDFGIAAVEAQATGCPVIAYQQGGQAEIIKNCQTGLLFKNQTAESLQDAIKTSSKLKWSVSEIRNNATRFSRERFIEQFKMFVNSNFIIYATRP